MRTIGTPPLRRSSSSLAPMAKEVTVLAAGHPCIDQETMVNFGFWEMAYRTMEGENVESIDVLRSGLGSL